MRRFLPTLSLFLLLLLLAAPAGATYLGHADYARSEPAADAVLAQPPQEVKVWFTQELFRRAGENWLHVIGPDGARVDVEPTTVDDNDRTLLTVPLVDGLADGPYRVEWRALSADDGHPKEGEFSFIVGEPVPVSATTTVPETTSVPEVAATQQSTTAPSAVQSADTESSGPESSDSSGTGGLPCLGAAPLALLVVGTVVARRRRYSD